MATLNKKPTVRKKKKEVTHEGAPAARVNSEQMLRRSVMSCLLWEREFYESGEEIAARITKLVSQVDPEAVAKIAVEARTVMKLRHVPLLLARIMVSLPTHKHLVGDLLAEIIQRPDELTEFLSIYWKTGKTPIAKQVRVGLAKAFTKFNEYSLAKYNRDGSIKLRDVLFLCHAKPKDAEQDALWKRLIDGKLVTPDTWEVEISESKDKTASWTRLLKENKLGGLALIRNLRNMQEALVLDADIRQAFHEVDVSKVLPFRFIAASRFAPKFEPELEMLMFKSAESLPKLKGKTVILVDVSGSMDDALSAKSDMRRKDAACGLAMVAREVCETVEIFAFESSVHPVPSRRGFALRDAICQWSGGTLLGAAVKHANKVGYDRLIVITDEQSSDPVPGPQGRGYMINVASNKNGVGYGEWTHFDGFSESIISFISEHEKGDNEKTQVLR